MALEDHKFTYKSTKKEKVFIDAGYCAYVSEGKVLSETYVACSGNMVVIIHDYDKKESILCVDSRRHGIPALASPFRKVQPIEVILYDSMRDDVKWYESGLEPPLTPGNSSVYEDIDMENFTEVFSNSKIR